MAERSVHGNAVNEDIIYELPPVEESWECDAANLPTSWKPCESCGYIFDPTNPHRLLVAFTENDEGVIQFTNASGHNGFQIVADTTFKQSRAKQHWKWMHGLRWNPANSVRQDSAKDIAQVTKVKSIIDRHRQCPGVVQQPQGDARVARNAPEPSSTANRSGYMHTRRISVIQTPQSEPSHERPRRSSGQGGGHDRRKRARTSTPNVPTPESRVPLSTAQSPQRQSMKSATPQQHMQGPAAVDAKTKAALDAMWMTVRQIGSENPAVLGEALEAATRTHLKYLRR